MRLTARVIVSLHTPTPSELDALADRLASWQVDPWAGHLHPGDLGWHSLAGADQTAADLRVWRDGTGPAAVAMLDGGEVLRLAVDPDRAGDTALAAAIAAELTDGPGGGGLVEARGAAALRDRLSELGWTGDEPWTPLVLDLARSLDLGRAASLRVERVGADAAEVWTSVHWSAFKGTAFEDEARRRAAARWRTLMEGPFADRAISLVGYADDVPVAVTTVWSAGPGRPGLIEPMGVHRDHHGHGYGVAITLAAAHALREAGASSTAVVAEGSNPAALATYLSAGFSSLGQVTDLARPATTAS